MNNDTKPSDAQEHSPLQAKRPSVEQSDLSNLDMKYDLPLIYLKLSAESDKLVRKIAKPISLKIHSVWFVLTLFMMVGAWTSGTAIWLQVVQFLVCVVAGFILGMKIEISIVCANREFRQYVLDNDGFGHKK